MRAIEIQPDVYWINVNDGTTDLFEALWSIPGRQVHLFSKDNTGSTPFRIPVQCSKKEMRVFTALIL